MDQLPRSNEGFANNNMFADSQQYNAYDNMFHTGADQSSYDASWGVNASNYQVQSRAQPHTSAPSWPQDANHLSAPASHQNINGQASPYARSLSHSPLPYAQSPFNNYGPPQHFQYRQPQYDPSLVSPHIFNQNFNYTTTDYQIPNAGTIAPHALQHDPRPSSFNHSSYDGPPYHLNSLGHPRANKAPAPQVVDQRSLISAIPAGTNGGRFSIINFDDLAKATNSERMGSFLNVGIEAHNWEVNRAALPAYVPRKSRNELSKLAGNDPKLLAKLGKKKVKKEKTLAVTPKPLQSANKTLQPSTEKIKYEDESSSEEESSSSDDESSYSSEDEGEIPLPAKRPDRPKEATEYDTIKALWRGKRKTLDSGTIKKGLGEFWEIVKTVRDRWKTDLTAFQDAEEKKRTNELPLLESRVKDQRDMLEAAFKAALKHGHRGIVELLGEVNALLYLCYQILGDRSKAEDYNGGLPRAMLETISLFTTLTDEKLEKTHLVKVLSRFIKRGDAKTQFYAKRINANAAAGSKEAQAEGPSKKEPAKENKAGSPPSKRSEPVPVAGVKRPSSAAADGGASKKMATSVAKANGVTAASKAAGVVKKSAVPSQSAKAATVVTTKPKQVVAKPSGLFSSLQSAAKKPSVSVTNKPASSATTNSTVKSANKTAPTSTSGNQNAAPASTFSFAETMANLSRTKEEKPAAKPEKQVPAESAEERAKRLRKESRRHLRVSFKSDNELVEVREFHHDPDEDLGHDASQVRDLADKGGEGRMFKQQHQMMDVDDEDEEPIEEEQDLLQFEPPYPIDFSKVDPDERDRRYARFGGQLEPESPERAVRERHEADTLLVFYTNTNDIPPNPREPTDSDNGETVENVKKFGLPENRFAQRAKQKQVASPQQYKAPQPAPMSTAAPAFELSKLAGFPPNAQTQPPNNYQPPTQASAPAAGNDAISSILASLKQNQANQATPPLPNMSGYSMPFPAPPTNASPFPTQQSAQQLGQPPNGQPDLAAILAQIQQNQSGASQPPTMAGYGYHAQGVVPNMAGYAPQGQAPTMYENPERKQWRDGGGDAATKLRKQNPAQNPYFRTKVCKYWEEGRCQKGDQCSYKHAKD